MSAGINVPATSTARSTRGWSFHGKFLDCRRSFALENRTYPGRVGRRAPLPLGDPRCKGTFVHDLLRRHNQRRKDIATTGTSPIANPTLLTAEELHAIGVTSGLILPAQNRDVEDLFARFCMFVHAHGNRDEVLHVEEEFGIAILPDPWRAVPWSRYAPDGRDTWTPAALDAAWTQQRAALATLRLDLVIRDLHGRVRIVDHKTTAAAWKDTTVNYAATGQFARMWWLGRAWWPTDFAGPLIDYFAVDGPTTFRRVPPAAAPGIVEDHLAATWHTEDEIRRWDAVARSHRDWPGRGDYFCPRCDHYDFCSSGS
jgi:hypothetical protein